MNKKTILIVDDDEFFCRMLRTHLGGKYDVLLAHNGKDGLEMCREHLVHVLLLDQQLSDADGTELCPSFVGINDRLKIIFITGFPQFSIAVEAIKLGAFDYLSKPLELAELDLCIAKALRTQELENKDEIQQFQAEQSRRFSGELTGFLGLDSIRPYIALAAQSKSNVLITGETGVGKNVVARAIHDLGERRDAPFISTNLAALPATLIEAELFGYEKGAFTSAANRKRGAFELADGGTLFLDEIGEMPLELQPKLLSVLDDMRIQRLGAEHGKNVSLRVVTATNVDLQKSVQDKRFRADLFHRINVLHIHIPPLRERPGDLRLLAGHFLRSISRNPNASIRENEFEALARYPWPGNVRELRNVVERSVILRQGLGTEPVRIWDERVLPKEESAAPPAPEEELVPLVELEEAHIRRALRQMNGNLARSASALGISLSTLKRKVKLFGIPR